MGKSKKKKKHNPTHKKVQNQYNQDETFADNDELFEQPKCPHESKAVKPTVLQNKIPHIKLGKCAACNGDTSTDVGVCICLRCGNQGCDRSTGEKHSLAHYQSTPSHSVVVHLQTWIVWCYQCDNEVTVTPDSDLHNCIRLLLKAMKLDSPQDRQPQKQKTNVSSSSPKNETKLAKFSLSSTGKIKGLTNLGNTCFFNAVMQNLCQTDLLHVALTCAMKEDIPHVIRSKNEPQLQIPVTTPAGSLTTALWKVLRDVKAGSSHGAINPKQLFNEVCKKAPRFRGFQQQDSQELLRYLLDSVRTEELRRIKLSLLKSFGVNQQSDAKLLDEKERARVKEYGQQLGAPVVDCVFAGELVSIVICQECNEESRVYEMFLDLSLPLSNPKKQQPSNSRGKASKQMNNRISEPAEDHSANTAKQNRGPSKHQQKIERKAQRKKNKGGKSHGGHQKGGRSSRRKSRSEDEDLERGDNLGGDHQENDGEVSKGNLSEDENEIDTLDEAECPSEKDGEITNADDERDVNTADNGTKTELCASEDYQGKEREISNKDIKKNEGCTAEGDGPFAKDEEITKTDDERDVNTADNGAKTKLCAAEDYQRKQEEISNIDVKKNEGCTAEGDEGSVGKDEEITTADDERHVNTTDNGAKTKLCAAEDYQRKQEEISNIDVKKNEGCTAEGDEGSVGKDEEITNADDERHVNTADNGAKTKLCAAEDYQRKQEEISNIDVKKNEGCTAEGDEGSVGKDEEITTADDERHVNTADNGAKTKLCAAQDYQRKQEEISNIDVKKNEGCTAEGDEGSVAKDEEITTADDERHVNTADNGAKTKLCAAEDYQRKQEEIPNIDVKKNEGCTAEEDEGSVGKDEVITTADDERNVNTAANGTMTELCTADDTQGKEGEFPSIDLKKNERKTSTTGEQNEIEETLVVDFQRRNEETSTKLGTSEDVMCHTVKVNHFSWDKGRVSIDMKGEYENSEERIIDMVEKNPRELEKGLNHSTIDKNIDNTCGDNMILNVGESENSCTTNKSRGDETEIGSVDCAAKTSELESWMADEFVDEEQEPDFDNEFDLEAMCLEIDNNSNADVGMLVSDLESDEDVDDDYVSSYNNNSRRYIRVTSKDLEELNKNFCAGQNCSNQLNDTSLPGDRTNRFYCLRSDDDNCGDFSTLERSGEGTSSASQDVESDQTGSKSNCGNCLVSDDYLTRSSLTDGRLVIGGSVSLFCEEDGMTILSRATVDQRTGGDVTLDHYKTDGLQSRCTSDIKDQMSLPGAENTSNQPSPLLTNGESKLENSADNVPRAMCQGSLTEGKIQATNDKTNRQFTTKCCQDHYSTETKSITREATSRVAAMDCVTMCNAKLVSDCVTRCNAKPVSDAASGIGDLSEDRSLEFESCTDMMNSSDDKGEKKSRVSTEIVESSLPGTQIKAGNVVPANALGGNAVEGCCDGIKGGGVNGEQEDSERKGNSNITKESENDFRTSSKRDLSDRNDTNSSEISCNKNKSSNNFAVSEEHVEVEKRYFRDITQNCESTFSQSVKNGAECIDVDTSCQQEESLITENNVIIESNENESGAVSPDQNLECKENIEQESLESQSLGDIDHFSAGAVPSELEPESHIGNEKGERSLTLGAFYYPTSGECSVTSCLSQFCLPEMLDGGNKFACEVCSGRCNGRNPGKNESEGEMDDNNEQDTCSSEDEGAVGAACNSKEKSEPSSCRPAVYTVARKQMLISSAPPVLTLHLKRFQHVGMGLRKLSKHVDFPLLLDLAPFCSKNGRTHADSSGRVLYALYGVVEHSGGMYGGHYTAFVKVKTKLDEHYWKVSSLDDLVNLISDMWGPDRDQTSRARSVSSGEGQWYYVSDTHVSSVPVAKVLRSQAYMLFYERLVLESVR